MTLRASTSVSRPYGSWLSSETIAVRAIIRIECEVKDREVEVILKKAAGTGAKRSRRLLAEASLDHPHCGTATETDKGD